MEMARDLEGSIPWNAFVRFPRYEQKCKLTLESLKVLHGGLIVRTVLMTTGDSWSKQRSTVDQATKDTRNAPVKCH